jgi:hypothetical protein
MLPIIPLLLQLAPATVASAQTTPTSYWLMRDDDGNTWCGYSDAAQFKSDADKRTPTDSAVVSFLRGKMTALTLQTSPESGDWIVIDQYVPREIDVVLGRTILLAQAQLQFVQSTTIWKGNIQPFVIESVTTLSGKKAEAPKDIDLPDVKVSTNLSAMPFMPIVAEMRTQPTSKLCNKSGSSE